MKTNWIVMCWNQFAVHKLLCSCKTLTVENLSDKFVLIEIL